MILMMTKTDAIDPKQPVKSATKQYTETSCQAFCDTARTSRVRSFFQDHSDEKQQKSQSGMQIWKFVSSNRLLWRIPVRLQILSLRNATVVLNLEGIDVELAQRIIDFTSGACYSLGGSLQKVSSYIFILGPDRCRYHW